MVRLFSWLSVFAISMILIAGFGVYWQTSDSLAKARQASVAAIAKGATVSLSAQIELLNKTLDKMAEDPDVLTAVTIADPVMMATVAAKLEKHLPDALKIRLLLPGVNEIDEKNLPRMGFADLALVRETLAKNQPPGVQGEKADRHLAIARQIKQNDQILGVILASLDDEFISKNIAAAAAKDIYMELKQSKSVLAAAGAKLDAESSENDRINVANTDWALEYRYVNNTTNADLSIIAGIIIPALCAGLAFFTGYRRFSDILTRDLNNLMKAFKDMVTNTLQGNYPFQLTQMSAAFSNLMQFKRVVEKGDYETGVAEKDDLGANIIISDDENFDLNGFFDDSDFKL